MAYVRECLASGKHKPDCADASHPAELVRGDFIR
jgi:hypothetical protein